MTHITKYTADAKVKTHLCYIMDDGNS